MNTNKIKNQRDILLNIAMAVSGIYTMLPLYMMIFGFMSAGLACFFSLPAMLCFLVTLTLNN
jgi:hypothetical protein